MSEVLFDDQRLKDLFRLAGFKLSLNEVRILKVLRKERRVHPRLLVRKGLMSRPEIYVSLRGLADKGLCTLDHLTVPHNWDDMTHTERADWRRVNKVNFKKFEKGLLVYVYDADGVTCSLEDLSRDLITVIEEFK